MNSKLTGLFFLIILLSGIFFVSSFGYDDKVSDEVYDALEKSDSVRVVVKLKDVEEEKGFFIKTTKSSEEIDNEKKEIKENVILQIGVENVRHDFGQEFSLDISKYRLDNLKNNDNIEFIKAPKKIYAFLQDSVSYINASVVWSVNLSDQNITGINETICIIDTGIDFTHSDLVGKNKTCVINCITENCVPNCSIGDDNGHGTHVAGIAVASGNINGVARGANLIGVKVLNGSGVGTGDVLNAGINWCIANRVAYNIGVISMSLGDCSTHNTYCNTDDSAVYINNATFYNISVIVSAGNGNSGCSGLVVTDGPSSPACVQNATAVGSITDLADSIYPSFQRGSLFELMAPGININSTVPTGVCNLCTPSGYSSLSGTSMATPHVAGAFALFRQFFRLQNGRVPTPDEIKTVFNSTGKQINDSSGTNLNFSRIDVYAAIESIDVSNPVVSLVSPTNNTIQFTRNVSFSCSANDVQLDNITLYVWNLTGVYNDSVIENVSGTNGNLESNIINISYGNYEWNCLAYDENGNFSFANSNYSFSIGQIATNLNSPSDDSFVNTNQTYNCSAETEPTKLLSNITFYVWNSTNDLVYNTTENVNGTTNSSLFYFNFTNEEEYFWNCLSYNNESENDEVDNNFTITYDITSPSIENKSESSKTSSSIIIGWDSDEIVNASIDYGTSATPEMNFPNANFRLNHSISLTGLSASTTYHYNITSCDRSNNCVTDGINSFTTNTATVINSPSGGSSPSSTSPATAITLVGPMTYEASVSDISGGYSKSLKKDERINFSIFDFEGGRHLLTVDEVGDDYINLTIESDPINFVLGVGQSIRLNLTSPNYYDLFVGLDNITNGSAELTIQLINEAIEVTVVEKEVVVDKIIEGKDYFWIVIILVGVLVAIVFVVVMVNRSARGVPSSDGDKKSRYSTGKELKDKKSKKKDDKKIKA